MEEVFSLYIFWRKHHHSLVSETLVLEYQGHFCSLCAAIKVLFMSLPCHILFQLCPLEEYSVKWMGFQIVMGMHMLNSGVLLRLAFVFACVMCSIWISNWVCWDAGARAQPLSIDPGLQPIRCHAQPPAWIRHGWVRLAGACGQLESGLYE